MAKCQNCGQYFYTVRGLRIHLNSCKNDKLTDKLLAERLSRQITREIKRNEKALLDNTNS